MGIKRYGDGVTFIEGKSWQKILTRKGINTIHRNAMTDAGNWVKGNVIPARWEWKMVGKSPFNLKLGARGLLARSRELYKDGATGPGAPDLRQFFQKHFGGWDPWGKAAPDRKKVLERNQALLRSGAGGYQTSRSDQWTRAYRDYRRWAKQLTKNWIARQKGSFPPITLTGKLASVAGTGKVKAKATAKAARAEVTVPRAGRQNREVRRAFGALVEAEKRQTAVVIERSIQDQITGTASQTKLGKKQARAATREIKKTIQRQVR